MKTTKFFLVLSLFIMAYANHDLNASTYTSMDAYTNNTASRAGLTDDFSEGLSPNKWYLLRKHWGKGNNGVVPELVSIEKDNVNGTTKNVIVLRGHGDLYNGPIKGVKKVKSVGCPYIPSDSGQRVGAALITKEYFSSGTYEVVMKIEKDPNDHSDPTKLAMCTSIWAFHYEEHHGKKKDSSGKLLNPDNPIYQPRFKEGNSDDGWYSTVNSEIDTPELGHTEKGDNAGDYTKGWYNTYTSEVDQAALYNKFDIPNILDGQYHTYKFVWETELVPTDLSDTDFAYASNYNYSYVVKEDSPYQGQAAIKKDDQKWYVYQGKAVTFYIDDQKIGENNDHISPVSARIIIGVWFPTWCRLNTDDEEAGKTDPGVPWAEAKLKVSSVSFKPANSEGDVYYQHESFPDDGLFKVDGVQLPN